MKFGVIGLGRFGYHLATVLAENGMEVLAVDSNEEVITAIRDYVTHAVCMRITDEAALRAVGMEEMDTIVVAMGENFAESILVTALLKKRLHVRKVITRAVSDIHKEILLLVGADQVILPEREVGIHLADCLSSSFTDLIRLSKDFSVSQIPAPKKFVGKKVEELQLFPLYKIHCIGLQQGNDLQPIEPEYIIKPEDRLVFSGKKANLEKIAKL